MRKLKLQRYRKHKEEWLIWLLFQSFAQRCGSAGWENRATMENVRMNISFDGVNRSSGKWLLVIWLFLVRDCICL